MTGPRAAALALALCLVGQAAWAQAGGACRPGRTVDETNACAVRDYQEADTAIQIQYGDVMRALSAHERPGLRQDHANRRKTHCPQGHEYTAENTRIDRNGKRHCRTCDGARKGGR